MNNPSSLMPKTFFCITLASAMLMFTAGRNPVKANTNPARLSFLNAADFQIANADITPYTAEGGIGGSIHFTSPPGDAPTRRVGGGVRGQINFAAPGDAAPRSSASGGVRGNVSFAPPGEAAPRSSASGGVRGNVSFAPPGEAAPRSSASGGVRGNVNFDPPGRDAPNRTASGGVRGNVNFDPPGRDAPNRTASGGVRGNVSFEVPGEAAPRSSASGGVRGDVNFDPPGRDAPSRTASGGARGEELTKVIPLIPSNSYGRTVSGRPSFLVYVPPTAAQEVFFSLQDADGNHHYQKTFIISGQGGIVQLTLPDDAPELEMGKEYVWFFAPIAPNSILRPDNYSVTGWIKRVSSPVPREQVSSLTPVKLATIYAQEGIWYDTLQILNAAKLAQPDNQTLASEWSDLLKQVGLEAIANEPITEQL